MYNGYTVKFVRYSLNHKDQQNIKCKVYHNNICIFTYSDDFYDNDPIIREYKVNDLNDFKNFALTIFKNDKWENAYIQLIQKLASDKKKK